MGYLIKPLLDQKCGNCERVGGVKRLDGARERTEVKAKDGSTIVIEPGRATIVCCWCGAVQKPQESAALALT